MFYLCFPEGYRILFSLLHEWRCVTLVTLDKAGRRFIKQQWCRTSGEMWAAHQASWSWLSMPPAAASPPKLLSRGPWVNQEHPEPGGGERGWPDREWVGGRGTDTCTTCALVVAQATRTGAAEVSVASDLDSWPRARCDDGYPGRHLHGQKTPRSRMPLSGLSQPGQVQHHGADATSPLGITALKRGPHSRVPMAGCCLSSRSRISWLK